MREKLKFSLFDIMGQKETTLTRAIAVMLYKDKTLLNRILRRSYPNLNIKFSKNLLRNSDFYFEKNGGKYGRTDIEILNCEYHIIFEAKIGSSTITYNQAKNYSEILHNSQSKQKLFIFLTQLRFTKIPTKLLEEYKHINYSAITWADIFIELDNRKEINVNLIEELKNSIKRRHKMKIYDIDIWAVKLNQNSMKLLNEKNIYMHSKLHNPIFLGLREWDDVEKKVLIKHLYPVIKVSEPNSAIGKNFNKNISSSYVYQLGKKLTLENPIRKKFSQAGAISLSFEDIDILDTNNSPKN